MKAFEQEKSKFHLYRQKYQPKFPKILHETYLDSST